MSLEGNEKGKNYHNYQTITDRTFQFSIRIINLCNFLNTQSSTAQLIANQLFRSGTSIGANIEESQATQSKKDFIHKRQISLKEARETRYWLKLLISSKMVSENRINLILDKCEQLIKIIAKTIVTAKANINNNEKVKQYDYYSMDRNGESSS
jgi:four helix bundle protein